MGVNQVLSYGELMELAKAYYNHGGDSVYECWDERDYQKYVEWFGPMAFRRAIEIFESNYAVRKDIEATAW